MISQIYSNSVRLALQIMAYMATFVAGPTGLAVAQQWGCYDPQPGHPTDGEKVEYVEEIRPSAQEAEQRYGPPAAALIAMACVEGGYGWTRTALHANNLFGWKYNSVTSSGGRACWVLECQPPEDKNNRYIKFRDER